MRNFRIKKRTKPIFVTKSAFINVILFTGMVAFLAAAVLTGKAVSTEVIGEKKNGDSITVTGEENNNTDNNNKVSDNSEYEESVSLDFEGRDYYLIQLGVFSKMTNAEKSAASISSLGGAGYIREEDGKFYVFAMCYKSMDDAQTVSANLKKEGRSAMIKCFSQAKLHLSVKGSEKAVSDVETATNGMLSIPERLEELIFSFDKEETDRTKAKEQMMRIMDDVDTYADVFAQYSEQHSFFAKSEEVCREIYNGLSGIIKSDDNNAFSAGLKYNYINAVLNIVEHLDNGVNG